MLSVQEESSVGVRAAGVGGQALAGVIRGIAALRPARKPLHPQGEVHRARLVRLGLPTPTGVPWLDEAGEDDVLVRWSRAVGLPWPVPDIHGLAMRVHPESDDRGDLLLATTGWRAPARVLLLPGFGAERPMTSLLPYQTPAGPVVLGAVPGDVVTTLHVATPTGPWQRFALLHDSSDEAGDEPISFDPVLNPLPGLAFPAWVRRLREPAYRTARASRE